MTYIVNNIDSPLSVLGVIILATAIFAAIGRNSANANRKRHQETLRAMYPDKHIEITEEDARQVGYLVGCLAGFGIVAFIIFAVWLTGRW